MSDMNYPIYQYSYFLPNGAQVVIRHEKYDEFQERVEACLEDFPIQEVRKQANVASSPITEAQGAPMCPIHHKEMKQKVSKAGKPYTAHWKKLPDGSFDICFGKGWSSERPGQNMQQIKQKINQEEEVATEDTPF